MSILPAIIENKILVFLDEASFNLNMVKNELGSREGKILFIQFKQNLQITMF